MFVEQVVSLEHYTSYPVYRTNDIDTSVLDTTHVLSYL